MHSVLSDIAISNANETTRSSHPRAQAANENERIRLKRTFRLLRKTDDLDTAIHFALGPILEMPLTEDQNILTAEGVEDIVQSLPSMNLYKAPGFFNRIPLPFRILRCVMVILNIDPVPNNFLDGLRLSDDERTDTRLHELLWFLMLIGSDVNEVSELLEQHRVQLAEMRSTLESHGSQEQRNTTASLHTPPLVASTLHGNQHRHPTSARAQNATGAQAQSNHQDIRTGNHPHGQNPVELQPTPEFMNVYTPSHLSQPEHRSAASSRALSGPNKASQSSMDPGYFLSKKGSSVEYLFKDRKFSGAPSQSVNILV